MAFVLDWKQKLGYAADPFIASPTTKVTDYFVGRDAERERLNIFIIKQARFGIIQGPKGSGKSTLLAWLREELVQHGEKVSVLLLDDPKLLADKNAFPQALLEPRLNLFERAMPKQPRKPEEREQLIAERLGAKRLLLLVDNANELVKENWQLLVRLSGKCPGLQVILVLDRVLKEHEEIGEDALAITLDEMPEETLFQLIEKRIARVSPHGIFPFDEPEIKKLIASAKRSPVKLLSLCQDRAIQLSLKVTGPPSKPAKGQAPKQGEKSDEKKQDKRSAERETSDEKKTDEQEETDAAKREEQDTKKKEERAAAEKPKKKWFSIKIIKEEEKPLSRRGAEPEEERTKRADGGSAELDAKLLEQALNGTTEKQTPEPTTTPQPKPPAPLEVVIPSADEKEKKEEKPAKRRITESKIIKGGRRR